MQRTANCLFDALAIHDTSVGMALRAEVADFLVWCAQQHPHSYAARLWVEEANRIRCQRALAGGSHVSIIGYSALRQCKAFIHTRLQCGRCDVQDATHSTVPRNAPLLHVLYTGDGHYDALVEVAVGAELSSMQPAWEQPLVTVVRNANHLDEEAGGVGNQPQQDMLGLPHAPLQLWNSFVKWAYAPERADEIPAYVLHILVVYIWLLLTRRCPAKFLAELQGVLRRTLPEAAVLLGWVWSLVHRHTFQ